MKQEEQLHMNILVHKTLQIHQLKGTLLSKTKGVPSKKTTSIIFTKPSLRWLNFLKTESATYKNDAKNITNINII